MLKWMKDINADAKVDIKESIAKVKFVLRMHSSKRNEALHLQVTQEALQEFRHNSG